MACNKPVQALIHRKSCHYVAAFSCFLIYLNVQRGVINNFAFWKTFSVNKIYKIHKINNIRFCFGKLCNFFLKIIAKKFAQFENL